jgi:phosphoesterase RecJ-like protein
MSHRWAPVLAALSEAQRVLLVGHVNPDADALGSALATGMALRSVGRDVQVTFPDEPFEVPAGLLFLPGQDLVVAPESVTPPDVVISMDASSGDRQFCSFRWDQRGRRRGAGDRHARPRTDRRTRG